MDATATAETEVDAAEDRFRGEPYSLNPELRAALNQEMLAAYELLDSEAMAVPVLEPGEIDAAVRGCAVLGIIEAKLSRMKQHPRRDPVASSTLSQMLRSKAVQSAHATVTQYRSGQGGPDHAEIMKRLAVDVLISDVVASSIKDAALWLAENPGTIVPDVNHGSGKRRVF